VAQRDYFIRASRPLLEPDEQVANVVKALEGPNRWLGLVLSLAIGFVIGFALQAPILALPMFVVAFQQLYAKRFILATDESLVIVEAGRMSWKPKRVLDRLPVDTRIGPLRGLWLETRLAGHRLFVAPRWAKEVAAADQDLDA
jgi:hypothetical protein